jgi:Na+/phosphate symporter
MIVNDLPTNVRFIALYQDHLLKAQRKEVQTIVGHVMNLETMDEKFTSLVEYIKYKLLERNNQKLKAQWAKEHVVKMVDNIDTQMQDFDILHVVEVKERKWGWHLFDHLFISIHAL